MTGATPVQPLPVAYTDRSSTIASGGVSQQAAAANPARRSYRIQNPSTEGESLFFRDDGSNATMDRHSIELIAGQAYETPAGLIAIAKITVIAATTGHTYHLDEAQ